MLSIRHAPALARSRGRFMNCHNCGAPLELVSTSGTAQCAYCESHRVLPRDGHVLGGVTLLGSPTDVDCPACGDQLVSAVIDDEPVRACPSCFGVAIRQSAFGQLVTSRRANYRGADAPAQPLNAVELQHSRECPHCRETMEVHPYYGPGCTVIDSCRRCGVVWLDPGELTAIERAPGRR